MIYNSRSLQLPHTVYKYYDKNDKITGVKKYEIIKLSMIEERVQ
jgi:hypothetical protein